jgi:outer membrane protein assembly factor BamB
VLFRSDLLIVMTETGEVVLLEPAPQNHRELGRFQAFKGKTWNPPALAGNRLYARTDREAACYQLPIEK